MTHRIGPKPKRSAGEILTAIETAAIVGTRQAGKLTGIPWSNIHLWKTMEKEGVLMDMLNEKCNDPASEANELSEIRQQNRALFVEQAMRLALTILQKMEEKVDEATFKDLSVSFGILLDKILLMTGHATSRTETVHTVDREDLLRAAQEVSERVKVLPKLVK